MLETPVLFIVFNRPDTTSQVFERIRTIQPKSLYVVADGPRKSVQTDLKNCNEVREIVSKIDWECNVRTEFKEENVGPENTIKNALNWFFNEVEYGIILEDDCLPSLSFFIYCERLLKKFQQDESINIITGCNFFENRLSDQYNYFIGDFMFSWGWASWARVFKDFKWGHHYSMEQIEQQLNSRYNNRKYANWLFNIIKHSYESEGNWDAEFLVSNIMNNKKGITPAVNLISNIGDTGTHYNKSKSKILFVPASEFEINGHFEDRYTTMSDKLKNRIINNFLKLDNPLNFRDRLYLFKSRLLSLLNK